MMERTQLLATIAERVDNAASAVSAITQLSESGDVLSLDEAYAVQAGSIQRRLDRGERLVGIKMGFTSRAKMIQMGVDDLIWGRLTDAMHYENGGELDLSAFIHPRIEPEVAFLLKAPLSGVVSRDQALAAVEAVAPALEIIDSRYENFKFSLEDVVADNSSSSAFVVGDWQPPSRSLSEIPVSLEFDGSRVQQGSTSDILGDPVQALVEAARLAATAELTLESGWIVMAGAATAAEPLRAGVTARIVTESLGTAAIRVKG